jgi:4-hydroxybenzoate polyprenyltransferase
MTESSPNSSGLALRFWQYQKERYPFIAYFILIGTFSFSAISYSRISRLADEFIDLPSFFVCVFNTVGLFFLVRVFDEFKDHEDDVRYRKSLPVPRGLISLPELKIIGWICFGLMLGVDLAFAPGILPLLGLVLGYLALMGKEFFIAAWLKRYQFWYISSHMFIIPLVDVFASGFDWHLQNMEPPSGLLYFFMVSYMNGVVLEIGRKIKSPETEEEGVVSYSKLLGARGAVLFWIALLFLTAWLAWLAMEKAGIGSMSYQVLTSVLAVCLIPALVYLFLPTHKNGKNIEYASALWTLGLYLSLGGLQMILSLWR